MPRPPKPTKLHVLQGTARPSRIAKRGTEPDVTSAIGVPPDWMPETGRQEWIRCVGHPVIGQLLSALHKGTFEHYCVLYDRFVKDAMGTEPMKASDRAAYHSLCMQLGFTPAAQSKVSMPTERKPQSAWDLIAKM